MEGAKSKNFLKHIEGLRGWAILMVVLFHLFPESFSQGFLGVDCFLVISGFLLIRGFNNDKSFSIIEFANKKILRLTPLLVAVIALTWILLIPVIFEEKILWEVGGSSMSSLLFSSNFYYLIKYRDYFAVAANNNPLLNTWYLSVIVQIYICWSFAYYILQHLGKTFCKITIYIVFIVSFCYNFSPEINDLLRQIGIPLTGQNETVSYFDPFARMWQIAAGGIFFILPQPQRWVASILGLVGIITVICVSFCNVSLGAFSPILMVFGTILVIKYGENIPWRLILENNCMMWLGKISFSLYLIHFPILVIFKRAFGEFPDAYTGGTIFGIALLTAWGLWYLVEKRRFRFFYIFASYSIVLVVSCVLRYHTTLGIDFFKDSDIQYPVYTVPGMNSAMKQALMKGYNAGELIADPGATTLMLNKEGLAPGQQDIFLPLGNMKKLPEFVLVGDSHAQQIYPGFHELAKDNDISGVYMSSVVVPLWNQLTTGSSSYSWTEQKAQAFLHWLSEHDEIHTVVVAQNWERMRIKSIFNWKKEKLEYSFDCYVQALKEFCSKIKELNKGVILLDQAPIFYGYKESAMNGRCLEYVRWRKRYQKSLEPESDQDLIVLSEKEHREKNKDYIDMLSGVEREGYAKVLDFEPALFERGRFLMYGNHTLNMRDRAHMTPASAIYLMKGLKEDFIHLLKENREAQPSSW